MTEDTKNRLIRALIGAGVGGGLGKAKKGNKGMLAGAALGGMAGGLSPEIINELIRKPIGRVVTNIIAPFGYPPDLGAKEFKKHTPGAMLRAVINDKPIYVDETKPFAKEYALREMPYRKMFGLPTRDIGEVKDIDKAFVKNPDNSYWFNPQHPQGKQVYDDIVTDLKSQLAKNPDQPPTFNNPVLGNWYPAQTGKNLQVEDRWDFNLHPNEHLDSPKNVARWLMSKLTNPVTFSNKFDAAELKQ
jgi:hypothetical protein